MDVAGGDQLRARMAFDDGGQLAGIEEKLAVHVSDAGLERRMVQEQERGPFGEAASVASSHCNVGASSSPCGLPGTLESSSTRSRPSTSTR